MRFAVFSDIHANWEALEQAAAHSESLGIRKWVVLGDTIGYGANPNECFRWAQDHAAFHLMGNHEKAIVDPSIRSWFQDTARIAIEWTAQEMDPALKKEIEAMTYLKTEGGLTFAHSSPDNPEDFRYILSERDAEVSFKRSEARICFIGHTHVPACFVETKKELSSYLAPGKLKLDPQERYLLNPGSVGQPRDRDPRLSFGIFDEAEGTFEIVRLPYDNQKAAAKIRRAGLPAYLADRLL